MTETVSADESYGNGIHMEITAPDYHWIGEEGVHGYHGWPTLTGTGNGRLALVCSGDREGHVDPFGRVLLYESADGGRTWNGPKKLTDGPFDDRDAGIVVTQAGTWLVNYFTSLAFILLGDREGEQAHWKKLEDRLTISDLRREHGFFMLRSTDGGKSWSCKYHVPANNVHGPIVLHDGSLFFCGRAFSNCRIPAAFADEMVCLRSTDDGLTWEEVSRFRTGDFGEHQVRNWHEIHSVETESGKLITQIRYNFYSTLQIESTDGGRSWGMPHTVAAGFPPHLLKLRDGRLLMSYSYRTGPYEIRCRVSSDEGESWSAPIILSDDAKMSDMGYPSTAELADGTLVTAWYESFPRKGEDVFRPEKSSSRLRCARWCIKA